MQLTVFVVRHGILLQLFGHRLVIYLRHAGVGYQLDDIKQLARVATAVAQYRFRLFDHHLLTA